MYLGHLGMAWLSRSLFFPAESLFFLAAASMGPDLVDKPLSLLLGGPGRGVAHTLLGFGVVCVLAVLARRLFGVRKRFLAAGLLLWLGHLATDLVDPVTLAWPFLGELPASPQRPLSQAFYEFYILRVWPVMFWLDIGFVGLAGLHAAYTRLSGWRPVADRGTMP